MSKVRNCYELIPKEFLNDDYYNPNKCKGVPLHPFRMIIAGSAGAGKTNAIFNLLLDCNCFERVYIYAKQLDQAIYKYIINKLENVEHKLKKNIITYSEDVNDIPQPSSFDKTKQNLVIIDDMIMEKNLTAVENMYVRARHQSVSVAFLSQGYYPIPKIIRMNTNYLVLRGVDSMRDFKMIVINFCLDKTPQQLFKMYQNATKEPMEWFMIDLVTTNPKMRYRKGYTPISDEKLNPSQALMKLLSHKCNN